MRKTALLSIIIVIACVLLLTFGIWEGRNLEMSKESKPPSTTESPQDKKLRLETKKLELEIKALSLHDWLKPQAILAFSALIAAIAGISIYGIKNENAKLQLERTQRELTDSKTELVKVKDVESNFKKQLLEAMTELDKKKSEKEDLDEQILKAAKELVDIGQTTANLSPEVRTAIARAQDILTGVIIEVSDQVLPESGKFKVINKEGSIDIGPIQGTSRLVKFASKHGRYYVFAYWNGGSTLDQLSSHQSLVFAQYIQRAEAKDAFGITPCEVALPKGTYLLMFLPENLDRKGMVTRRLVVQDTAEKEKELDRK